MIEYIVLAFAAIMVYAGLCEDETKWSHVRNWTAANWIFWTCGAVLYLGLLIAAISWTF